MSDYGALNARARGLSAHLFTRGELEGLAGQPGLEALARALQHSPRLGAAVPEIESIWALELVLRRAATRHLRTLSRWGPEEAALEVFFASLDRRNIRSMLRGAVQAAPAESRLNGLLPTPGLPERVLTELARQPTVAAVTGHLFALGRPEAHWLLPFTKEAEPALFSLELALLKAWAERATRAAKQGDAHLRAFVAERLDVALIVFVLLLASGPRDVDPATCFIEGGRHLDRALFLEAAKSETRRLAAIALDRGLALTPLRPLLKAQNDNPAQVEQAALALELERQRAAAKRDPLSSAPLMHFLLRLEAQSVDLVRLAWAASLGAPPALTRAELVTPWK